jgi:hypothetical protein
VLAWFPRTFEDRREPNSAWPGLLGNAHRWVPNNNRKDQLMSRDQLRMLGGAAGAAGAIVASAHITVNPDTATRVESKITRTMGNIDDGLYQT